MVAAKSGVESVKRWHKRLGHIGYANSFKLVRRDIVKGTGLPDKDMRPPEGVCEPCIFGKHHRNPFPVSFKNAKEKLELVHMDVCGPISEVSLGGSRYVSTFLVYDYTQ